MITIRPLQWPNDRPVLLALDTSFFTDQIYQVVQTHHTVTLQTVAVAPPLRKDYQFAHDVDSLPTFAQVLVAEVDSRLAGIAAIKVEAWNRRSVLEHFYIAPSYRGRGLGRHMMNGVIAAAQQQGTRCLWLETQNINYGAIQFYERMGFQWCGLDRALYDLPESEEIALFFVRDLA